MTSLAMRRGPAVLLLLLLSSFGIAEESDARRLDRSLRPLLVAVSGQEDAFRLMARVDARTLALAAAAHLPQRRVPGRPR